MPGSSAVRSPADLGIGQLFETVRDAVVVADASSGRIVLWNPAAETMFGYSVDEALGMPVEILIPAELRGRHRHGLARFHETGRGAMSTRARSSRCRPCARTVRGSRSSSR
jgi:PAS domain S-box-containing protein